MVNLLTNLKLADKKVLVVVNEYTENVILAARNLQNVVIMLPEEISVLDILSANKMLVEEKAMESINEVLK